MGGLTLLLINYGHYKEEEETHPQEMRLIVIGCEVSDNGRIPLLSQRSIEHDHYQIIYSDPT